MDSRDEFRLRAYAAEKRVTELEAENARLRELAAYDADTIFKLRKKLYTSLQKKR